MSGEVATPAGYLSPGYFTRREQRVLRRTAILPV